MAKAITSQKKAHSYSFALFIVGLGIISYTNTWWPDLLLVIGIPIAFRQYLVGHLYDMVISLIVFLGGYLSVQFEISSHVVLPVILTIGGLYIFLREFLEIKTHPIDEDEEDLNHEIEEEQDHSSDKKN